jgi:8-oxo-dGTP pyrophosphatase MutT (NUDIX family)
VTPAQAEAALVQVIRGIPGEDESPAAIEQLCETAGFDPAAVPQVSTALLRMLEIFGVLRTVTPPAGTDVLVKADTTAGSLFLRSLAEYLVSGNSILDNWSRARTVDPPYGDQDVLVGTQFLSFIERRRLGLDPSAPAIRRTRVAKVLVKTRVRGAGASYLVLHDQAARQFQFPGGHSRRTDATIRDTAVRELEEELPGFRFDDTLDRLVDLGTVDVTTVSRTYGAATTYELTFFHLVSSRRDLPVGPNARWLPEAQAMESGPVLDGLGVNVAGLDRLLTAVPGGLPALEASLQLSDRNPVVALAIAKPLEFWGFVLGFIGIALSVVFFVLA